MIIDHLFQKYFDYLDIESIKQSLDVIYIVDEHLVLRAYNDAWIAFAKENNGESVLVKYPIGSTISKAFRGPIKRFIVRAYKESLSENKPFEYDYECPSTNEYRLIHQTAYPLVKSKGLVVSNHTVKECPHNEDEWEFRNQFVNTKGFITQCSNCRKIKDPTKEHVWLWVPSLVEKPFPNTSHGLCQRCYDHYYPEIDE